MASNRTVDSSVDKHKTRNKQNIIFSNFSFLRNFHEDLPCSRMKHRVNENNVTYLLTAYNELSRRGNECTVHQKNLQKLMLEVYNSLTQQNPSFSWDMFNEKDNNYDLR